MNVNKLLSLAFIAALTLGPLYVLNSSSPEFCHIGKECSDPYGKGE
ncbi:MULTISPECIES: hypothetical protein [Pseudoalteromonas]|uniref:Uncharacterized protein n=1 Tax=Pseudoalteromonas luteoviolacea (strain 2ta16) TaxID=1353533 RepID=V4HMD4_PSEL2|nr:MULTISPECIES: hypothetical protein [Pseudoalteromonas]ESP91975.1 hypothetical protein PL2TA16_05111 [Pseudoalteromonas luteoviolacea 2ta16]KZN32530.1 hypothetical protein N483_27005 [Pseudoalteromonas luteoviolacea NCIMB 1944]MCG7551233.1 hypothetical protein [Pseudoalteromonas sp. Of7M-16]